MVLGAASWQAVLTGLAQMPAVIAPPTNPVPLLAEVTRYEADLLLLVLRTREALREQRQRRTLLLAVLQSPVPVLLLPLVG